VCLFKGLLKNALVYMSRRNDVDKVDGSPAAAASYGNGGQLQQSKGIEEYLMEQIQNILGLFSFGFELPAEVTSPWSLLKSSFFNGNVKRILRKRFIVIPIGLLGRGKKNKNLGPMLAAGAAVMAGTLVPIAFGALFMLAGKAIMTSLMAITISGLLGLKALFGKQESSGHVKAYSALPPPPHYSEAQFEQDLGIYKGQTEAKMHGAGGNFFAGESNLSSYYKGAGSEQPEYFTAGAGVGPKFDGSHNGDDHDERKKTRADKND